MEAEIVGKVADKVLDDPAGTASWTFDYAGGYIKGFEDLFGGADKLEDRHRSLQLTLANATKHDLLLDENYFDSGTWYHSFPARIKAGDVVIGFVANSQGSVLTGVSGGLGLRLEGTNVCLGLGFTNPQFGSYKLSAILLPDFNDIGEKAYNQAEDNYAKRADLEGFELQARQIPSHYAMMGFAYSLARL